MIFFQPNISSNTAKQKLIIIKSKISICPLVDELGLFLILICFAAYNCRYVTCDYAQWGAWSATCGVGMKRTRILSKVNENYIKKQGGCAGLKVTCGRLESETKTTNCKYCITR